MEATRFSRSLTSAGVWSGELPLVRYEGRADLGLGPRGGESMVGGCRYVGGEEEAGGGEV